MTLMYRGLKVESFFEPQFYTCLTESSYCIYRTTTLTLDRILHKVPRTLELLRGFFLANILLHCCAMGLILDLKVYDLFFFCFILHMHNSQQNMPVFGHNLYPTFRTLIRRGSKLYYRSRWSNRPRQ